jgi:hypothetical protein
MPRSLSWDDCCLPRPRSPWAIRKENRFKKNKDLQQIQEQTQINKKKPKRTQITKNDPYLLWGKRPIMKFVRKKETVALLAAARRRTCSLATARRAPGSAAGRSRRSSDDRIWADGTFLPRASAVLATKHGRVCARGRLRGDEV